MTDIDPAAAPIVTSSEEPKISDDGMEIMFTLATDDGGTIRFRIPFMATRGLSLVLAGTVSQCLDRHLANKIKQAVSSRPFPIGILAGLAVRFGFQAWRERCPCAHRVPMMNGRGGALAWFRGSQWSKH